MNTLSILAGPLGMLQLIAVGGLIGFIGSLPPDLISLSVSHTSLREGTLAAALVAIGASLIETLQVWVSFSLVSLYSELDLAIQIFRFMSVPILWVIGLSFLLQKEKPGLTERVASHKSFFKGLLQSQTGLYKQSPKKMETYDLIIIGTGAGGGTLARKLAPTGKKILILERGDFLPRERENWDVKEVFSNGRYRSKEKWYDQNDQAFEPFTHYWVGGNTKMYGSALLRLRESDFTAVQHFDGVSPAWPLSYDDFEPYYQQAEEMYMVHGSSGYDPTEPPRSKPFPFPALEHEPRMKVLFDDLKKMGHSPSPLAIGVNPGDDKKFPQAPVRLSNFDGFPDLTQAKQDSHVVGIDYALNFDNVSLVTGAYVEKLETDSQGKKVSEVIAKVSGEEIRYRGDVVIVSCGAVNSAALLLRSANQWHPNGLANSSDQVGRNYMIHNNGTLIAISEEPNPSVFQKSLMITEFYHGASDIPCPLGSIQMMGKTDPDSLAAELLAHPEIKEVLPNATVEEISRHSIDFFLTSEDLPLRDNRISIRKDGSIKTHYKPNNLEAYQNLRKKLIGMMEGIGCKACAHRDNAYVGYKLGISGVSHQNGTCRFGTDPDHSVLDTNCKTHDLDNLYVVDTSFFPSSGAVNPSLTAMANALRVGDHLIERMK